MSSRMKLAQAGVLQSVWGPLSRGSGNLAFVCCMQAQLSKAWHSLRRARLCLLL